MIRFGALLPAAAFFIGTAPASAPEIIGRWASADGKAVVEIAPCGPKMCGCIVKVLSPAPGQSTTDIRNPDPAKRSRPILGLTILSGFTASGDRWAGQIYDPKVGKTYTSYLSIDGARLKVKGCVGPLCRTQYWNRAR
jgi:uncharacterized protein (DUF2147 family)